METIFYFFGLICLSIQLISSELNHKQKEVIISKLPLHKTGRIFLLTYPRSGTHWMFYILQHFTKRPVVWDGPYTFELGLEVDPMKPCIRSSHLVSQLLNDRNSSPNLNHDKLIIIIRNPIESIIRHLHLAIGLSFEQILNSSNNDLHSFFLYENLQFFEQWPIENRHLIYYENLMKNPQNEIPQLLKFLNEGEKAGKLFIKNLRTHKENGLKIYDHYQGPAGGSLTKGEHPLQHSESISQETKDKIIKILYEQNPQFFIKYFGRYFNL